MDMATSSYMVRCGTVSCANQAQGQGETMLQAEESFLDQYDKADIEQSHDEALAERKAELAQRRFKMIK
jgi:hypothetical protein